MEVLIDCKEGTYIRSIARDCGELLKTGGNLTYLERLQSGSFHASQHARTFEEIKDQINVSNITSINIDYVFVFMDI